MDTLALREHMHLLSSSFHDANIVKVLHGSDSDIMWLQRDFGLYVINMFDTGQVHFPLHTTRHDTHRTRTPHTHDTRTPHTHAAHTE